MTETRGDVRWHSSATISTDYSVYDVRFAPFHLSLKFAAALGNGQVVIIFYLVDCLLFVLIFWCACMVFGR